MPLVLRSSQSFPLTNQQVDDNFIFLNGQLTGKLDKTDFVAAQISAKLNTLGTGQSTIELAEDNALNAWLLRDNAPSIQVPGVTDKTSVPVRDSAGKIYASTFVGALNGNADTATLASDATVAQSLSASYTVPITRGGTNANTAAQARANLEVLHIGGTNSMTGKLQLMPATANSASINFGASLTETTALADGDMWATTSGLFFHISGNTRQVAQVNSQIFTGTPRAPGFNGDPSQIATLSHLENEVIQINSSLSLKAPLASPTFTGVPAVPTAATGTSTTQIASTAFVKTAIDNSGTDITAAYKAYTDAAIITARNAINIDLSLKANIASPALTGEPTSPTPPSGNNSTRIATTQFTTSALATLQAQLNAQIAALQNLIANTQSVPTGTVLQIYGVTVPVGYLEANGQEVLAASYPNLYVFLGSPTLVAGKFKVPDLRGVFMRNLDRGKGIDTNRILGSLQGSQNLEHTHRIMDTSAPSPNQDQYESFDTDSFTDQTGGRYVTTTPSGGNEARPINIALMAIIKT